MSRLCKYYGSKNIVDYGFGPYCRGCNRNTTTITKGNSNRKNYSKSVSKKYKCNLCGKKLKTDAGLNQHQADIHEIGLKCSICGKVLVSNSSLQKHIKRNHTPKSNNDSLCKKEANSFKTTSSRNSSKVMQSVKIGL